MLLNWLRKSSYIPALTQVSLYISFCSVPGRYVRRKCGELGSAGSYNTDYILQGLQPQL